MRSIILLRMAKTGITSGLAIRSKYLWRYRVSVSRRPWNFSGSGFIPLEVMVNSWASMVTWPVRVRITGPDTPRWSPKSRSFKSP